MILRHHPGPGQPAHDAAPQVLVGGQLPGRCRANLVATGREIARRRAEVMGRVSPPVAPLAVADRAVRHVDAPAELGVSWLRRSVAGSPDEQAAGNDPERLQSHLPYSSTTNWPTT